LVQNEKDPEAKAILRCLFIIKFPYSLSPLAMIELN
jgi:hypothetical protein